MSYPTETSFPILSTIKNTQRNQTILQFYKNEVKVKNKTEDKVEAEVKVKNKTEDKVEVEAKVKVKVKVKV